MVYYDFMQRQIENYRSKIDREQSEERRLILSEQRETQRQERLKDHQNYKHQLGVEKQKKKEEYETKKRHSHIKNKGRSRR